MRKLFKILGATLIGMALFCAKSTKADSTMPLYEPYLTVQQLITQSAIQYQVDPQTMLKIANWESTMRPNAYNHKDTDGLPKYGLYQFGWATFYTYAPKAGITNPDIWNPSQQAKVAAYMFSIGQGTQWGTYSKLKT